VRAGRGVARLALRRLHRRSRGWTVRHEGGGPA
jgi:hypothetical protein